MWAVPSNFRKLLYTVTLTKDPQKLAELQLVNPNISTSIRGLRMMELEQLLHLVFLKPASFDGNEKLFIVHKQRKKQGFRPTCILTVIQSWIIVI